MPPPWLVIGISDLMWRKSIKTALTLTSENPLISMNQIRQAIDEKHGLFNDNSSLIETSRPPTYKYGTVLIRVKGWSHHGIDHRNCNGLNVSSPAFSSQSDRRASNFPFTKLSYQTAFSISFILLTDMNLKIHHVEVQQCVPAILLSYELHPHNHFGPLTWRTCISGNISQPENFERWKQISTLET